MKKLLFLLFCCCLQAKAAEIKVDNAVDFFTAIGSNTTIRLAPGDYNMSNVPQDSRSKFAWFSYNELIISGVQNLTIIGEGYAEIGVEDPYSSVIRFTNSEGIDLQNLIMGHFVERGYCTGAVLNFEGCRSVSIDGCEMYGSGTHGIVADDLQGLKVTNSVIKDCSYGVISLTNVTNVEFIQTQFKRCQSAIEIDGNSKLILFEDCYISGISDIQEWASFNDSSRYLFFFGPKVQSVLLKNNRIEDNGTANFYSNPDEVKVKGSKGGNNTFELD